MTIPKKGSRHVTIGTKQYRYVIRSRHQYVTLTVQEMSHKPGAVMQCTVENDVFTPGRIVCLIEQAIKQGWRADGGKFLLENFDWQLPSDKIK